MLWHVRPVEFAMLVEDVRSALSAAGLTVPMLWGPPRRDSTTLCLARRGSQLAVVVEYRERGAEEVVADLLAGIVLVSGASQREVSDAFARSGLSDVLVA